MPDTASITIRKSFTYLGQDEEWVNTYHLSPAPGSHAAYTTIGNAIWDEEREFLSTQVELLGYYGYEAGNETSVVQVDFADLSGVPQHGTQSGILPPGDAAVWVRWKTADRTSKGKPIYLRKYFHGVPYTSGLDQVDPTLRGLMATYGAHMADGSLPGGIKLVGPQGAAAGLVMVNPWFSHRDLKRTGKRPH